MACIWLIWLTCNNGIFCQPGSGLVVSHLADGPEPLSCRVGSRCHNRRSHSCLCFPSNLNSTLRRKEDVEEIFSRKKWDWGRNLENLKYPNSPFASKQELGIGNWGNFSWQFIVFFTGSWFFLLTLNWKTSHIFLPLFPSLTLRCRLQGPFDNTKFDRTQKTKLIDQ